MVLQGVSCSISIVNENDQYNLLLNSRYSNIQVFGLLLVVISTANHPKCLLYYRHKVFRDLYLPNYGPPLNPPVIIVALTYISNFYSIWATFWNSSS